MKIHHVAAREADRHFSALLASAERDGETIVITRRGRPIARLIPEPDVVAVVDDDWLSEFVRPMGGGSFKRDELYDRGDCR